MKKRFYAHSIPGRPVDEWQPLEEHLMQVARMARAFAEPFHAGDWAWLSGLWHDLGKYSKAFQCKLCAAATDEMSREAKALVDHSTAGARHAHGLWPGNGKLLAYIIAGHHGGLPDGKSNTGSDLAKRLDPNQPIPDITPIHAIARAPADKPKPLFLPMKGRIGFQLALYLRMIFSCLTDADFLDTEKFLSEEQAKLREGRPLLSDLEQLLFEHLAGFRSDSQINRKRAAILNACVAAASEKSGLFTLTVPTGGGKTLSSLAFAMRHARIHDKRRIIYVIPFTSIIEQNAAVFRSVLGEEAVLEHHSNYVSSKESAGNEDTIQAKQHRMACENWDVPLVVTTNVQFFESLFSNRSAACRKLHNIAGSVVILDEAQMLPEPVLRPCIEMIRELSYNYGCTIVLCTATQPALTASAAFPEGLPSELVTEIMPDPAELHNEFKRVRLSVAGNLAGNDLAGQIVGHHSVLCIVNTRQRAFELFRLVQDLPGSFHLSARMCPAHRTETLAEIRRRLKKGELCRVISTQLVEAGVDVDFPAVYREMAGLDSIAQAAGRCNRNAKLPYGRVHVFSPEDGKIPKLFRRAAGAAESVLRRFDDPFAPEAVADYFRRIYKIADEELDAKQILPALESGVALGDLPFREVARKFRMIESEMVPVIIPWDERAEKLISSLKYAEFPGGVLRRLQPYTVQIYPHEYAQLLSSGAVDLVQERYSVLVSLVPYYKKDIGFAFNHSDFAIEDYIL